MAKQPLQSNLDVQARLAYVTYKRAKSDVVTWAFRDINLPGGRVWDTSDRLWQIGIFDDPSRNMVIKKSAQTGLTITFLVKILHYLAHHSATCMYTLPRRDDISSFAEMILNKVIEKSPSLSSMIQGGDSVRLKQLHNEFTDDNGKLVVVDSNFHLAEASVEPRMIPVDILANDEIDRTVDEDGQRFLSEFVARIDNSPDPHHFRFSTPSVPGFGIDKLYETTTQNEWMVHCAACNYDQVLDWEKNAVENPPQLLCAQCRVKLPIESIIGGRWVPQFPEKDVTGYHVSHLMLPLSRPIASLWKEYNAGTLSKKSFYNLKLGLAFSTAMGSFSRELLMQCFAEQYPIENNPLSVSDNYYMGVDQADDIHLVVGKFEGKKKKIVYAEKISGKGSVKWQDKIINLIRLYHIRFCVVDALPNTHDAREILRAFPSDDRVALCHYSLSQEDPIKRDKEEGKVHVSRTEMFDGLRMEVSDGVWRLPGNKNIPEPAIEMLITHFTNLKRDEREDNSGVTKGVWITTGPDHFAHATNYLRIAMTLSGRSSYKITLLGNVENAEREQSDGKKSDLELVWGQRPDETDTTNI